MSPAFSFSGELDITMYSLQRLYAFSVSPQRRAAADGSATSPEGGTVTITPEIEQVIEAAFAKVARGALTKVDFKLNETREHVVRDELMTIAFGATQAPRAAASRLASRLAQTMDQRSRQSLLVLVVEEDGIRSRVSLLVFPREDVVQLGGSENERLLNLLRNAFSTGSALRKLARVEGHDYKTQFLSVEVLDFQLTKPDKATADFWVANFLEAKPRIDAKTASRQLAAALQRAFGIAIGSERDAVYASIYKFKSRRVIRTSLKKVAAELPRTLHEDFYRGIPNGEMRQSVFEIDSDIMNETFARREITTKDGVIISAPAETIGRSVEFDLVGSARWVRYSGSVEKERVMRSRRERSKGPKK